MELDADETARRRTVYLYELALELDERSTILAERAREAGLEGAAPSTLLTEAQAAALRRGVPMPPPPGAGPAAPPAPAAATPGALSWGSAAAPVAPAGPAVPVPPAAPGPGWVPAAPPPGFAGSSVPAAGTPGWPAVPGAVPPPPWPTAGPASSGRRGLEIGLLVGLVVVALGVFGFFFLGTSDNDARRRNLDARNAETEAQTKADAEADADKVAVDERFADLIEERDATSTTVVSETGHGVVDRRQYCLGAVGITRFEVKLMSAGFDRDLAEVRRGIEEGGDRWRVAVDQMVDATEGDLKVEIEYYRSTYQTLIDGVRAARSDGAVASVFAELPLQEVQVAAADINRTTLDTCS